MDIGNVLEILKSNFSLVDKIICGVGAFEFIIFILLLIKKPTHDNKKRFKLIDNSLIQCLLSIKGLYNCFMTNINIFPLLGMLGTVLALITIDLTSTTIELKQNFFVALTSTFWGILFSIFLEFLISLSKGK